MNAPAYHADWTPVEPLTVEQRHEFACEMQIWRREFDLDTQRAGELLGCLPQNILFIELATVDGWRAAERKRRFDHVAATMRRCRCAVRRYRSKQRGFM